MTESLSIFASLFVSCKCHCASPKLLHCNMKRKWWSPNARALPNSLVSCSPFPGGWVNCSFASAVSRAVSGVMAMPPSATMSRLPPSSSSSSSEEVLRLSAGDLESLSRPVSFPEKAAFLLMVFLPMVYLFLNCVDLWRGGQKYWPYVAWTLPGGQSISSVSCKFCVTA